MKDSRKKIGIALGGGGARGFCHIGVLQILEENNIPVDFIAGCSMGAVVGGCYAGGMDLYTMSRITAKFNQAQVSDFDITLKNHGLMKGNRAITFLKKHVGDINIEDCKIPFAAIAVNAKTVELVTFKTGKLMEAIRASMSIPGYFQSVTIEDSDCLIDGGILERIPINAAKNMGADVIIAVDALGPPEPVQKIKTALDMIIRAYNILDWECSKEKMKNADIIITPNQPDKSILDFKNNPHSVMSGRIAAQNALPQILELIT